MRDADLKFTGAGYCRVCGCNQPIDLVTLRCEICHTKQMNTTLALDPK